MTALLPPPPITKLIRNQQRTVKCIKERSGNIKIKNDVHCVSWEINVGAKCLDYFLHFDTGT